MILHINKDHLGSTKLLIWSLLYRILYTFFTRLMCFWMIFKCEQQTKNVDELRIYVCLSKRLEITVNNCNIKFTPTISAIYK